MPLKRRVPSGKVRTHLHKCGDYDDCHELEPLLTDCRACQRAASTIQGGLNEAERPETSPGT